MSNLLFRWQQHELFNNTLKVMRYELAITNIYICNQTNKFPELPELLYKNHILKINAQFV
jgi:hypothetical protein